MTTSPSDPTADDDAALDPDPPLDAPQGRSAIIYLLLAGFITVLAIIYFFVADDPGEVAGVAMLFGAIFLPLITGLFLEVAKRKGMPEEAGAREYADHEAFWLPHYSTAPVVVALGATVTLSGFAFGIWLVIPGVMVLLWGVVLFAYQSIHRHLH